MLPYRPEGMYSMPPDPETLHRAAKTGEILQSMCTKCDEFHDLHVDLGTIRGIIPREEAAVGIAEGTAKESAILSRVGKPVCFRVLAFDNSGNAILSRRSAQMSAGEYFLSAARCGDVIPLTVQNTAPFGIFCDIGCGYTALMRIDRCCVSRLENTNQYLTAGRTGFAAIWKIDKESRRIELTGRELLGTWSENAELFRSGQTVPGIVRSILPYGVFIELTPNLSGLAEFQKGLHAGDNVSVYIRSIQPDKHKIKLNILELLPPGRKTAPPNYFITAGHLDTWEYYPGSRTATYF